MDNFIVFGTLILICAAIASAFTGDIAKQVSAGLLRVCIISILLAILVTSFA